MQIVLGNHVGKICRHNARRGRRNFDDGCPVCGARLFQIECKFERFNASPILLSSHLKCPFGHFAQDFVTGDRSITIMGRKFVHRPEMAEKSVNLHRELMEKLLKRARARRCRNCNIRAAAGKNA